MTTISSLYFPSGDYYYNLIRCIIQCHYVSNDFIMNTFTYRVLSDKHHSNTQLYNN